MGSEQDLFWSAASVLEAIPAKTMSGVVGYVDFRARAVFEWEEMRGALRILLERDLIEVRGQGFGVTERGKEVKRMGERGWKGFEVRMGAIREAEVVRSGVEVALGKEEYRKAVEEYLARSQRSDGWCLVWVVGVLWGAVALVFGVVKLVQTLGGG